MGQMKEFKAICKSLIKKYPKEEKPAKTPWQYTQSRYRIEDELAAGKDLKLVRYNWQDIPELFARINSVPVLERVTDPGAVEILRAPVKARMTSQELHDFGFQWAWVFDKLFFFCNLNNHIKLNINAQSHGSFGEYHHDNRTIYLNTAVLSPQELILQLLHLQLHQFFKLFTIPKDVPARDGGLGNRGHGRPFCNALSTLEGALSQAVTFHFDLHPFQNVRTSMFLGHWRPTIQEIIKWGATQEQVAKYGPGGMFGDPRSRASEQERLLILQDEQRSVTWK